MKLTLEERLLLKLAKTEEAPPLGATDNYSLDNCLQFPRKTIPGFDTLIRGKKVLDYGCGPGWQAVAMLTQCGAASVFGLDINPQWLDHGRRLAEQSRADRVQFGSVVPPELVGTFDLVLSISAFEHFDNPAQELARMRSLVRPGGHVEITWAEPWFSPYGSHFADWARIPGTSVGIPWMNLLFSERALLTLRSRFRQDRPRRFEDIEGGLNKMTVAKFERILKESGMVVEELRLYATKKLPLVTRLPVLRELLTSAAACRLRNAKVD
jgi:SAM-dependent methyltransferase